MNYILRVLAAIVLIVFVLFAGLKKLTNSGVRYVGKEIVEVGTGSLTKKSFQRGVKQSKFFKTLDGKHLKKAVYGKEGVEISGRRKGLEVLKVNPNTILRQGEMVGLDIQTKELSKRSIRKINSKLASGVIPFNQNLDIDVLVKNNGWRSVTQKTKSGKGMSIKIYDGDDLLGTILKTENSTIIEPAWYSRSTKKSGLNPLLDTKNILPNAKILAGNNTAYTDGLGRTAIVEISNPGKTTVIRHGKGQRRAVENAVGEINAKNYVGGHIGGNQLGGISENINIVPITRATNETMTLFENFAKSCKNAKTIRIGINYIENARTPKELIMEIITTKDELIRHTIPNYITKDPTKLENFLNKFSKALTE